MPQTQSKRFGLSPRALWMVAGGFGAGLLLFFLLWLDMRDNGDFYRPEGKTETADGQVFEPLPAPMGDGESSASGLSGAGEGAAPGTRQNTAAPLPAPRPADASSRPAGNGGDPSVRQDASAGVDSPPVPLSKPSPDYPAEAIRNGESGKVVVRIDVGADGQPENVAIARSSRSRALDRAALQAAKRWRFRPAQSNGRAVAASVEVPIDFTLDSR